MTKSRSLASRTWVAAVVVGALAWMGMSVAASTGEPTVSVSSSMSRQLQDDLSEHGFDVQSLDAAASKIEPEDAVAVARSELPSIAGDAPADVILVSYIDQQDDPKLADASQPAWAVVMEGVEVPIFGPPVEGRATGTYKATLVLFIDAGSGVFLEAIAF